jgi:hypothetical protein
LPPLWILQFWAALEKVAAQKEAVLSYLSMLLLMDCQKVSLRGGEAELSFGM